MLEFTQESMAKRVIEFLSFYYFIRVIELFNLVS